MNATYTFPSDAPVPQLRGLTLTITGFCRADGKIGGEPDAVLFAEQVEGRAVKARIAGRPELEAAYAAYKAAKQAVADRLSALGWAEYSAARRVAMIARDAYDRKSEYGYPIKEAAAMQAADEALAEMAARHPGAAAYAKAEAYASAHHYQKSAEGSRAMRAIENGADPTEVVAMMTANWVAYAESSMD